MARTRVDPRARAMSEAQLQDAIIDFAELHSWRVSFHPDWAKRLAVMSMMRSRRGDRRWPKAGWPDLVMARFDEQTGATRLVIVELKSHSGSLEPEQRACLDVLRWIPGVEIFVWKPMDWLSGEVERVLD